MLVLDARAGAADLNEPIDSKAARRARLGTMVAEHYAFIWRLLRRLGVSRDGADDAAQQVFLIGAERIGDIRRGSERAFLFGTALRVARGVHRNDRREVLGDDADIRSAHTPGPEELIDQHRAAELLDAVLAQMELDLRTVFILFELEGFASPEIAKMVGVPVGTVASRLRRAREQFRISVQRLKLSRSEGAR
jgi:RNA polymerase sigma-70 factor (ECF subfamily)